MKKALFYLITLFAIALASPVFAQGGTIGGEVEFTVANKKKCNCECGIGFRCSGIKTRIEITQPFELRNIYASVTVVNANTLLMRINKSNGIQQALYQEVFAGKTSINVEEDWDIPSTLLTSIQYTGSFILKAGTYAISEANGFINITLTK